jgi:site-specific DNA-methyltransferase (adenine-specific)
MTAPFTLHLGDCIKVMRMMPDNSVDSVVTDPPYELGFMGKGWDCSGIANNVEMWREALRVLKPGAHLLAFSGSRTYHRMVCAIEDAGFEIRDQIMWVYGSGFPKSLDVSKAIDKLGAHEGMEVRKEIATLIAESGLSDGEIARLVERDSRLIQFWREGGRNISPEDANKLRAVLGCRIPPQELRAVIGEATDRRGDGTVYGVGHSGKLTSADGVTAAARQWQGWGTALKPAHEPICVARKPLSEGTVAANVLEHGTGALNIGACRIPGEPWKAHTATGLGSVKFFTEGDAAVIEKAPHVGGRWPANLLHDGSEEVLKAFPDAPGQLARASSSSSSRKNQNVYGAMARGSGGAEPRAEIGKSAARFFYAAKASRADRNEGCDGLPDQKGGMNSNTSGQHITRRDGWEPESVKNNHPTVKPTDLMAYLCRLVTPPGGLVLDPFMGSGSTGKAAMREGFRFIGVDVTPEYVEIARARIAHELAKIESSRATEPVPAPQLDLFGEAAA